MSDSRPILNVFLYTRPGCTLCDKVKAALIELAPDHPHQLIEVDISQEAGLLERYRFVIPVVKIGRQELQAPITIADLRSLLR